MVKVQFTKSASLDLKNIYHFIARDSKFHAKRFTNALKNRIDSLSQFPEKGRPIYLDEHPTIRQVLYKSYKIIYDFDGSRVSILVITHQSRLNINIDALKQFYI